MRRNIICAFFCSTLLAPVPHAHAQSQPIVFSAMGDVPYSNADVTTLRRQIVNHNKYSPSEFMVHVGDIKSGSQPCVESWYRQVAADLQVLAVPTFIVPGDNEWNGCANPDQGFGFWVKYFNEFEANFCGAPATQHQSVRHENFAFVKSGVLFIGIDLVGTPVLNQSQWNQRLQQDADWVKQQFAANVAQVRAAAVFSQAGPGSAQKLFYDQFRAAAAAFAKPVLLLHGDGHVWIMDHPFAEKNILRIQVKKGGSEDPVQVTVGLDAQNPWVIKRKAFSGTPQVVNMPPCVDAGPDVTATVTTPAVLAARVTDDGDPASPGRVTVTWSPVSGPGLVSFVDAHAATTRANVDAAGTYVLRLTASDGELQTSDDVTMVVPSGAIAAATADAMPRLALRSYPNPSAGQTTFEYSAPHVGTLHLALFDVRGRQVRSFSLPVVQPGTGTLGWDGRDEHGLAVGSGTYVYRLDFGPERRVGKVVMQRVP